MMASFMHVSYKLVFHQSKCISAIKRMHSTTATYVSSSSFMYLCIPCYCDARLKSSALRVGVKTLDNTMTIHPAPCVCNRYAAQTQMHCTRHSWKKLQ